MFKITPVQDIDTAKRHLAACGAKEKDGCFVYAMTDYESEKIMGISQFELSADYGYIYDIKEASELNDFEAMFILGRQTMNFINSCGLNIIRAPLDAADKSLLCAIGFTESDGFYECNTDGMFDGSHCSGHK